MSRRRRRRPATNPRDPIDEVEILAAARHMLAPWFDSEADLDAWAVHEVELARVEGRLLTQPPKSWAGRMPGQQQSRTGASRMVRYVEGFGAPSGLLRYEFDGDDVTLQAAWPDAVPVIVTGHAKARVRDRLAHLEPDERRCSEWMLATIDRALRLDELTLDAPRWAVSAPLKPGFGWVRRELAGDDVALLVAAPQRGRDEWKLITVLSRSTSHSVGERISHHFTRARRYVEGWMRHRKPPPVRAVAQRPPRLGDTSAWSGPRRGRGRRSS